MSIAGGVSWEQVLVPLKAISAPWVLLFLFYMWLSWKLHMGSWGFGKVEKGSTRVPRGCSNSSSTCCCAGGAVFKP